VCVGCVGWGCSEYWMTKDVLESFKMYRVIIYIYIYNFWTQKFLETLYICSKWHHNIC